MDNFVFCNPTRILFGKGQISELSGQVPKNLRAILVYGGLDQGQRRVRLGDQGLGW